MTPGAEVTNSIEPRHFKANN